MFISSISDIPSLELQYKSTIPEFPVLFTYLGGDLKIQHWQAHIQNRCYPTEEQIDLHLPTLYPDTRVLEDLALGTEDDRNGFNLQLFRNQTRLVSFTCEASGMGS